MAIDYQTREWKDDQAGGTPIDAANLNRMEQGIANACAGVDEIKGPGGVSADMIADGSISESKLSEDLRDFVSQSSVVRSQIDSSADWNDLESGTYRVSGIGAGGPDAFGYGVLLVSKTSSDSGACAFQMYVLSGANGCKIRTQWDGSWSEWHDLQVS